LNILFGSISNVDLYAREITIKCDFLVPEILEDLENAYKDKRKLKFRYNVTSGKSKNFAQQKCWYGSIYLILLGKEVMPTKDAMQIEDEEQRKSIFPVKWIDYGGVQKPVVKRMHECSWDEMQRNIEVLHERHQHLKINGEEINFSNLKLNG
jgi:hypothetical protein